MLERKLYLADGSVPTVSGLLWICLGLLLLPTKVIEVNAAELDFRTAVEADWERQEAKLGRSLGDTAALHDLLKRGQLLIDDLSNRPDPPNVENEVNYFTAVMRRARQNKIMREADREALYIETRWLLRDIALKNPRLDDRPLVFMKRQRFICQMLHEYLGYFYDYEDIAGGGVFILCEPGRSFDTVDLIRDRLPRGNFTTLALSYDAQTIYFAFAERAPGKPDFYSTERRGFHLYAMAVDGSNLRQLTEGVCDDFDPCPLPDGGIAFMSTRRGGFGRCHNPWEPLPTYTLHRMNQDGSGILTLSYHETNEWHPSVMPDGRIVYTRWDYVDRSAANYHGLWTCNPDGSNPQILFGNYTQRINACYQPRAIPGSNRVVFIAGAHHADVGGAMVIVDPSRIGLHPVTGQDDFTSLEFLTPCVALPEAPGWPNAYYHSPWPLSDNYFLVSYSLDPLPGMGPKVKEDTKTGLYYMDRFGNLELLYREPGISCMYPIPLRARPKPPVIPSTLDPHLGEEGEFILAQIGRSHFPLPETRPIRALRIFQVLPKTETHVANQPRLGYANAESARMLLGEVPVEADGSAYFRAPARKPLYFQAIDAEGRAVQSMRSITYLQPGERRGCVGCHEPTGTSSDPHQTSAMQRAPSIIQPGPDGSMPWSFPRLVQPILNRHCVRCHNGEWGVAEGRCNLSDETVDEMTAAYTSLKPYVRWFEWGGNTIHEDPSKPGWMPSSVSPLVTILNNSRHAVEVNLNDDERRILYLWLDGNASFYGTYSHSERTAQLQGEKVPPPVLQ